MTKAGSRTLFENTVMLYIMQFAGYFFSLLIVPYQTRVLSQGYYGALSIALGLMIYFTMLIDFGFMVSGVTEIAENRTDGKKLSECLTCVMVIRILLAVLSVGIMSAAIYLIPSYTPWAAAFYLYLAAIILEALLPMFFLRGMEDMRTVALLTLLSKGITTALILITVKSDADYLLVPGMRMAGAALSFAIAWIYITRKYKVGLVKVTKEQIWASLKNAFGFFLSRIASTVYRGGNTAILGAVLPASMVALYACPEKLMNVGMTMSSPISDSLLPHIAKTHHYQSAWRMMRLLMPVVLVGGAVGLIWAEPIIGFIFGAQYLESAGVFRAMIPVIAITPINYILAFPVLVPMGLQRQSNLANAVGAVVYIFGMLLLWAMGRVSIVSAAVVLTVTECCVAGWRAAMVIKHRDRLQNNKERVPS
ncbi:MAG: oligosaccharide flippase family protein [Oscillospiraceae bacterium]